MCPELDNPDSLESNEGQKYTMLPAEVKLSIDFEFLAVTNYDGSVKIAKMPQVFDPLSNERVPDAPANVSATPDSNLIGISGNPNDMANITVSSEISQIEHQDLKLDQCQIALFPPKKIEKFVDPYPYDPNENEEEEQPPPSQAPPAEPEFSYLLGSTHHKDSNGGDAGCLLKKANYFPFVDFIRSQYCGKF